jgi:hypothetical protein
VHILLEGGKKMMDKAVVKISKAIDVIRSHTKKGLPSHPDGKGKSCESRTWALVPGCSCKSEIIASGV